jgi:hypothetical protein
MGRIDAPLGEISSVGAGIESLATGLTTLGCVAGSFGGGSVSDPPATAAALQTLGARWSTAAQRLEDEIVALGVATQATAVAYRTTDESAMIAGGGDGAAGDAGGGGGGGAW